MFKSWSGIFTLSTIQVAVGRLSFVRSHLDLPPEGSAEDEGASTSGRTQVYVATSRQGILGRLEFEDALRDDARGVVRSLQRQVQLCCAVLRQA